MGCEIWVKIGDTPPSDAKELQYIGLATSSSYTIDYKGEQAGKTAHYMLRWLTTRGDKGPWSETAFATIAV